MAKNVTWRNYLRPIAAQVIRDNEGQPEKAIRKALRTARARVQFSDASHVSKVWREVVRELLHVREASGQGELF